MKTFRNISLSLAAILILAVACNQPAPTETKSAAPPELTKQEMRAIVEKLGAQFSAGVRAKDSLALVNIYTDSAQYVLPKGVLLVGKEAIGKDWAGFLRMKEQPIDLILNIADVRGTRDVIYETGKGYTLLADSTKWDFNYVNVWRLQADSTYKLEVDTYN